MPSLTGDNLRNSISPTNEKPAKTVKNASGCTRIDPITATIKKIPVSVRM